MRSFLALLVLVAMVADVSAQSLRERRAMRREARQGRLIDQDAAIVSSTVLTSNPAPDTSPAMPPLPRRPEEAKSEASPTTITAGQECADALAEVNAERAKRGLRPFVHDPLLAQGALACARERAKFHIHGHLDSDFARLPSGASATAAGCGALELSWGWGTCCTYDNYTYCGAAWVMGNDGRRYMHVFVR